MAIQYSKVSSKEIGGLKQAVNRIKLLEDFGVMSVSNKNFTKAVAERLVTNIQINYTAFVAGLGNDKQDRSGTSIYAVENTRGYEVRAVGSQIIYDEFGTGDKGENKANGDIISRKNRYGLKPYNSGPTIKESKNGGHYWWFKSPLDSKFHTSWGVEPGQFMYNGLMETADDLEFMKSAFTTELRRKLGVK